MHNPLAAVYQRLTANEDQLLEQATWSPDPFMPRPVRQMQRRLVRRYRHRQMAADVTAPPALGPTPFDDLTLVDPFVLWERGGERFVIVGTPGHRKTVGR